MENIEEDLKDRVLRLRKAAKHTQESLAAAAGISFQTIKDIESGRTGGGLKSLTRIAKALDITIEELKGEAEPIVEKVVKFKVSKMARYIASIPDDVYEMAVKLGSGPEAQDAWEGVRAALENGLREKAAAASQRESEGA